MEKPTVKLPLVKPFLALRQTSMSCTWQFVENWPMHGLEPLAPKPDLKYVGAVKSLGVKKVLAGLVQVVYVLHCGKVAV